MPDDFDFLSDEKPAKEVAPLSNDVDFLAILDDNPHAKSCNYRPWTNDFGVVYCLTCGATVGSTRDNRDALCLACGCFTTAHLGGNGACLMLVDGVRCPCKKCEYRV